MNLPRRSKFAQGRTLLKLQTPIRSLSLVAGFGLMVGLGVNASAVTPVAAAILQDEDHDHDEEAHVHRSVDGNVEVIVLDEDGNHQEIIDKLIKSKKLNRVDGEKAKFEVIVGGHGEGDHGERIKKALKSHKIKLDGLEGKQGKYEVIVMGDEKGKHHDLVRKVLKSHNIKLDQLQAKNGKIEVILAGDADSDHAELVKKILKKQNVKLDGLQEKDVKVEVIVVRDDDAEDAAKPHEHRIELNGVAGKHGVIMLHKGDEIGDIKTKVHQHLSNALVGRLHGHQGADHKQLAKQLRAIADKLDGGSAETQGKGQARFEFKIDSDADGGKHVIREFKNRGKIEIKVDDEKKTKKQRYQIRKRGGVANQADAHGVVLDLKPDGIHEVIELHKPHGEFKLHTKDGAKGAIFIERRQSDDGRKEEKHELHLEVGATSGESQGDSLDELRKELDSLRRELNRLKANRAKTGNRVRWIEEKAAKEKAVKEKAAKEKNVESEEGVHVIDGRNLVKGSKVGNNFVWVTDGEDKEIENKFLFKGDSEIKKIGDNVFTFETKSDFKKKTKENKEKDD